MEPCYQSEIATLREMLLEERGRLDALEVAVGYLHGKDATTVAMGRAEANLRIEALTTAIEALGGAL